MPKRTELIISVVAFTLPVWIFVLAFVFSLLIRRVPGFHQDEVKELVPIYARQSLTQTITLEQTGLDTVLIFLKNTGIENRDKFIFQIADNVITITGYNIGDGDTVRFQFPPLNLPVGSQISLTLTAPDTKNPDLAIKAGISASDAYAGGGLDGKYFPRDLSFQLFYQPKSRLNLLKNTWSLFWSRL